MWKNYDMYTIDFVSFLLLLCCVSKICYLKICEKSDLFSFR